MSDIVELPALTNDELREIAEMLPIDPPLAVMREISVREMRPDLTDAELEVVFKHYQSIGGRMSKK